MASWRIRFHDKWPHLASLYASTHNLDEDGKHPDPMMGQDNVFDPSEPYGAYRYYVQPSTRSEFSIEEPGYMSRPVYKDEESRSSDYTSGDSFRRGSNCRVLLCVSLVVSFVGVVVAAITLAVLLSKTPAPLPAKPGHTDEFESQASIFNREFNENLRDNTTDEFKYLEKEFCKAIEQMFTDSDSPVKNAFGGCEVLEFTNGSVQVRYRLKLFSDTFERFKMDKKITKKLEDHFAKKINEIGPWQNLKFNPKFVKKFIRIEPPTTPVPPTTKATSTPFKPTIKSTKPHVKTTPKAKIDKTTKQSEPVTIVTRSETPERTTERTTETTTTETTIEKSKETTTTMQLITTTLVKETKPPVETIQTTRIVKPSIITENEDVLEITTQEDIRTSEKITDVHTQKQTPGTIETTSRTTSDEIITTLKPTAEVKDETKAVDNITVTTKMPKASTNIFDMFYDLNDTYETTESGTTAVTELPTIASEVTYTQTILKAVTTTPRVDANQTSTTSPANDSVSKESSTVSEILPVETTIEKEISFTTQTDKTTSIEVTTLQSAQTVTDEIIQVTSDKTTDTPKETITGSKADEEVIETTTVVHEDSISSRTTGPANITVKGVDIMSTESSPTVDHNVSTSTTVKMQESTIQIKTDIATEFSNATMPPSVTTSQETEITISSELVDETKQPTVTTIPADGVTSTVTPVDTGLVTTQQSSEALKILVNETIGEQGITEPAPILNVSSISDILTTRASATESESSSTTSTTHIETTTVEVVKDSVTERYNKTAGPDSTLDKIDMQTSPVTIHAHLTTVAAPVTNTTTIMDTAKLEKVNETSSKGPELTTDATESSDVVEHITKSLTGVSEIVPLSTTDTYGYNTSDVYYDYETTTSSEVSVEPSTESPVELVSTQATKVSVVQESSTQGVTEQTAREVTTPISKTSSAETVGTTTSKSDITQEKTQMFKSTEGIKVTSPPTTQIAKNNTSVVSEVEITTQQQSVTSLLPNVTARTPDEVTITFSIVTSPKSTDEINVTTQSTDASTLHSQTKTTKDAKSVEKSTEIPVTVKTATEIPATEQVKAVTSSIINDTAPADVTTQSIHTESLAIERTSKPVSKVSTTVKETTGNGSATVDVIATTIPTFSVINETESFSSVPSFNETTSPSTTEAVQKPTSTETVPDITETAQTTTETQTDSPSQLINITDTSLLTTKQVYNDSIANVTYMESTTISDSVQETSPADIISETFTTETPVNVTDTIYADNMTTVDMQDTTETRNATKIFNTTTAATTTTTTTTTPKPAEEAFLDEYNEAAFNTSYVPTAINITEETSVISTSNNTKQGKTTITIPIETTLSSLQTGNVTETATFTTSDVVKNVTELLNDTKSINENKPSETDVTTSSSVITESVMETASVAIDNVTVLPKSVSSIPMQQNVTHTVSILNDTAESEATTEEAKLQPLVTKSLQTDTVTEFVTTTVAHEGNVTMKDVQSENQTLFSKDNVTSVVHSGKSTVLNTTSASKMTTQSQVVVESTTVSGYNTSDYYDVYNDTDYYYITTESPSVTTNAPDITVDAPVANVTDLSAPNVTNVVKVATSGVKTDTNDTVTASATTTREGHSVTVTPLSSNVTSESQTSTQRETQFTEYETDFSTSATSSAP